MLKAEQIVDNYESFIKLINDSFTGNRLSGLLKIYEEDFKDRVIYAPASAKSFYHSCFPGGYIYHVLNVVKNAILFDEVWKSIWGDELDYTREELIFSALNHDLGKLGTIEEPYYLENSKQWQIKNGQIYEFNENLPLYMSVTDRAIHTLQNYGITLSDKEFIGIKLSDGLYDEANKNYYVSYSQYKQLKTNLPYVVHQADLTSTRIEYKEWSEFNKTNKRPVITNPVKKKVPAKYEDAFKTIFGGK